MRRIIFLTALFLVCMTPVVFTISYAASKKEDYELQERCGKRAAEVFKEKYGNDEYQTDKTGHYVFDTTYTNHYNSKLNKCFILVTIETHSDIRSEVEKFGFTIHKTLWDVNENEVYASKHLPSAMS